MASVQEPGLVYLDVEKPDGIRYRVFTMRTEEAGAGGSPDHVVSANVIVYGTNTDKWRFVPVSGGDIERGDKLIMSVKLDASDGIQSILSAIDVSDCVFSIPITNKRNGLVEKITDADFTMGDITPAAATETVLGTYEFTGGTKRFGGGHIGIFIDDE